MSLIRFFDKVLVGDGCWEWQAALFANGYGKVRQGRKTAYAHRVAWEMWSGESPGEWHVMHVCDNRRCVRPDHLRLGTRSDNMQDCSTKGRISRNTSAAVSAASAWRSSKTHCLRGHLFDEANTRLTSLGHRSCRACAHLRYLERQSGAHH